jgi:hypothetical protein
VSFDPAFALEAPSAFARVQLCFLLQLAYSGERGAARAYVGHAASLRDPRERTCVRRILRDEVRHRLALRRMMAELGCAPDPRRERKLDRVGKAISLFCRVGGYFLPMYGAARLENQNIGEYERAARLAVCAGQMPMADELLQLAEVEWDHELFFRTCASKHVLWRVMSRWPAPPERASIRERFAAFLKGDRAVEPVIAAWLVR